MPPTPIAAPTREEMQALRSGVGLVPRAAAERLDLTGADRVRFLQNLVTCDVAALAAGRAVRGFLTHFKGGVVADADIVALDDRFRLVLPAGRGEAVATHLLKYRITDRVEVASRADLAAIGLRGERAPELLARLGLPEPAAGERVAVDVGGARVGLRREPRSGPPRYELETASPEHAAAVATLVAAGGRLGLVELSPDALELARIENLELAWGIDYGEENFPQETGEERAVSYTKGCYLGQEVVARIHYRGGVQRMPRRVRFEAGASPERGAELLLEGRPVGRATSLAVDPATGEIVGLALLHRRAAEAGTRLELAAGGAAAVAESFP
jgi:folate-binding protein YgfZ